MKTKVKRFSHKLLALFMAVIMGITCFSGVFSAYAASADTKYFDDQVEYNNLAWSVLSDEQTATALLDYLDDLLAEFGPQIDQMLEGALPSSGIYSYNPTNRSIDLNVVIINESIPVHLHSVDEVLETLEGVESVIRNYENVLGDAGNLQLSSTNGMRRSNTSSCDILKGILGILQKNSADYNGKDVLGEFLRGGFDLGTLGGFVNLDIYGLIGDLLGCDDGYESKFVYNVVQTIIFNNTNWFSEKEKQDYKADPSSFVFDDVLLDKMTNVFLQEINAEITYRGGSLDGNTVSSQDRYKAILEKSETDGISFKEAAKQLGYDPELVYTDEGNVRLFVYGTNEDGSVAETADKIKLDKNSTLFTFGYEALRLAWETALKDTLMTVRVNYNVDKGHGSNFDNTYYYWAKDNIPGGWDVNNLPEMYSQENINKWATAVYADYSAESPEEFLGWVKDNYNLDRTAAEDSTGSWSDIDETTLFVKLRYSPLADYGFNMETGPINLYLMQTGAKNLEAFFEKYSTYNSLVAGLNDALVAAVKDLFVDNAVRPNVYGDNNLPTLQTVNPATIDNTAIIAITNTLVNNALAVFQYTADATDSNILKAFYDKYTPSAKLTEANFEEAMVPFLIACIGQINLNGYKMEDYIHPEDWDACKDAEAVIFVALREYLSYILPAKNYNSLVEGVAEDGTLTSDTITASLDRTILPMARDAVVYVMQGYVPVTGDNGAEYDVYSNPVNDTTDIFELLNSVICYYGGEYEYKDSSIPKSVGAMGVGALLGVCDNNGRSLISDSNDLWTNINLVANHLMPVLGTLQYGDASKYGQFDSEELIYNDIVKGVLNIGDNSIHASGMYGVSNFVYRLLTIVSAEPIQSTPVTLTIYDLVADFINALFGARYDAQGWTEIIPARTSDHPFDDVLQNNVVVGTTGTEVGLLQKLICNFVEFCGYSTNGVNSYPDSILRGLMFAVQAVQSFVPSILGSVGEHQLKMGTADYDQRVVEGCSSGGNYNTTVSFTNNSTGVNKAYVDGIKESVVPLSRYYMKVKSVSTVSSTGAGCNVTGINSSYAIAPGETVTYSASSTYQPDSNNATTIAATFTYDICLEDGTVLYQNLETTAYQYLTGATGWESNVYPNGGTSLNADFGREDRNETRTVGGYNIYSSNWFRGEKLFVVYPEYMVVTTSSLDSINKYQFRVQNLDTAFGSDYGFDGFFCYDDKTVANDAANGGGTVTVNRLNAIPIYDKETGDILKYGKYDYSTDGGETWNRNGVAGYTQEEISNVITSNPQLTVQTRDHVVYTLQEAINAGIVAAYHQNAAGVVEYLYLKAGSGDYAYDTLLGNISLRGPVDGIYINQGKINVPKWPFIGDGGKAETSSLFVYDGETKIQAGDYPVNLTAYTSNSSNNVGDGLSGTGAGSGILNGPGGCTLVIGDDSSAGSLDTSYNNLTNVLANYRTEDFKDATAKTLAESALLNALSVQAAVITPTTAHQLSDNTYLAAVKTTVTTEYGDMAFKPFTTSNYSELQMPINVLAEAYEKNGIYYYDEACTMPIYSNVRLESTDVEDGKDPAGMPVIEGTGDDAGQYWLRNEPSYEKQWNTTAYNTPWREYVIKDGQKVQATDDNGNLLYEQVTYVYRDSRGEKVNSDNPEWRAKFPETEYQCIENTGSGEDNRGLYTQAADYLAYVEEYVYGAIDTTIADDLLNKISLVRNELNNNNFEVVTYNKMVDLAQLAESNYTINIPYSYEEPVIDEVTGEPELDEEGNAKTQTVKQVDEISFSQYNGYINNPDITVDMDGITTSSTLSSVQVAEYVREFDIFMNKVVERGYNGDQLEQEIKCASGSDYNAMTAVAPTETEDGEVVDGSVTFNSPDTTVPFGALDESGKLVNEGAVVYEDGLWKNYVNSLAKAVSIATDGNNDVNGHQASTYYKPDQKETYTYQVTECYSADTDLQAAEIALETATQLSVAYNEGGYVTVDGVQADTQKPLAVAKGSTVTLGGVANEGYEFKGFAEDYITATETAEGTVEYTLTAEGDSMTVTPVFETTAPAGYNVTASLVIATDNKGSTSNSAVSGDYTITLYKQGTDEMVGEPYTFTSATDANSFTLEAVPAGTYDMVISSEFAMDRTVTVVVTDHDLTGPAIPVVVCNYDGDTVVTANDALSVYEVAAAGTNDARYNVDGDTVVTANDALIVYSCAAGAIDMPAITIE